MSDDNRIDPSLAVRVPAPRGEPVERRPIRRNLLETEVPESPLSKYLRDRLRQGPAAVRAPNADLERLIEERFAALEQRLEAKFAALVSGIAEALRAGPDAKRQS